MKAIILARVSSKEQEDNYSTPAQVASLTAYCNQINLPVEEIVQLVESSTKSRKLFQKVIDKIKKSKEPLAIVVDCVDRLQRRFNESIILDEMRKEGKIELHFKREGLVISKNSNSSDILRWDMGVMFAKAYVLQLSDNVKRGNHEKRNQGGWTGKAPIGYLNTRDQNDKPTIIPDPDKAHIIRFIFEQYAEGNESMLTLLKKCTDLGLFQNSSPRVSSIEHILKNPFYYGEMRVKSELYPHKYEPIISRRLFMECIKRRELNFKGGKKTNKEFIFRGIFKCAKCGCTITGDGPKKGNNIYYRCSNQGCANYCISVNEKDLLKQVLEIFQKLIVPDEIIKLLVDDLKATAQAKNEFHHECMKKLRSEYDKIERRIQNMYTDKLDGVITTEQYEKYTAEFRTRQKEILLEQEDHNIADQNFYLTANRILEFAKRSHDIFLLANDSEKNKLLTMITSNPILDGKTPYIYLEKPFDSIFKNSDVPTWHGW